MNSYNQHIDDSWTQIGWSQFPVWYFRFKSNNPNQHILWTVWSESNCQQCNVCVNVVISQPQGIHIAWLYSCELVLIFEAWILFRHAKLFVLPKVLKNNLKLLPWYQIDFHWFLPFVCLWLQVFEVAPSLHMVELRKTGGDTLEFHKFYKTFSSGLQDIVWNTNKK